jgi:Mg2+-importing ATPase
MPAPDVKTEPLFWQLPVTALMEHLGSSPEGLSSAEAALRLAHFGPNLIHTERKRALILQFLAKFRNPLVIILLTAPGSNRSCLPWPWRWDSRLSSSPWWSP